MMNVLVPPSECTSGCESGWTLYFEHSTSNNLSLFGNENTTFEEQCNKEVFFDEQEDVEEDLSMVSDASSGPPHLDIDIDEYQQQQQQQQQQDYFYYNNGGILKRRNIKSCSYETQCCYKIEDFVLDDTASSHVFTTSKKVIIGGVHEQNNNEGASFERSIDYSSQCYSDTRFQERSNIEERLVASSLNNSRKRFHQHSTQPVERAEGS